MKSIMQPSKLSLFLSVICWDVSSNVVSSFRTILWSPNLATRDYRKTRRGIHHPLTYHKHPYKKKGMSLFAVTNLNDSNSYGNNVSPSSWLEMTMNTNDPQQQQQQQQRQPKQILQDVEQELYFYRDLESLLEWAVDSGIEFASGMQLVEEDTEDDYCSINDYDCDYDWDYNHQHLLEALYDSSDCENGSAEQREDWNIVLTSPQGQGTALVTIPEHLILSSARYDDDGDTDTDNPRKNNGIREFLKQHMLDCQQEQQNQRASMTWNNNSNDLTAGKLEQESYYQYLPECLLLVRLLEELSLGTKSLWYPWLQSLPKTFSTGLYMDEYERSLVQRMAPQFLIQQMKQWQTCRSAIFSIKKQIETQQRASSTRTQTPIYASKGFDVNTTTNTIFPPPATRTTTTRTISLQDEFQGWLLSLHDKDLENVVKWAFSIVFTRSWRTPDGIHATIVPLGDMFNHDSVMSNVQPFYLRRRSDDDILSNKVENNSNKNALILCLTDDYSMMSSSTVDNVADNALDEDSEDTTKISLHLNYGMSEYPARFLVVFGFCDTSAPYVDAHLDEVVEELKNYNKTGTGLLSSTTTTTNWLPPIDTSQLVVSTSNGALSEEVWNVFLFKVLQQYDPSQLQRIQKVFDDNDQVVEDLLGELLSTWEWTVALELKAHIQHILDDIYSPITVQNKSDKVDHPRLPMIVKFNRFMRKTFQRVMDHVDIVMEQTSEAETQREPQKQKKPIC